MSRRSGASTCSTTAPRASPSWSTPEDGWSWTAPVTGVPERAGEGVKYQKGVLYRKLYDYVGKATYVLGEFYWRLERDAKTYNTDYIGTGASRRGASTASAPVPGDTQEITWSAARRFPPMRCLKAFKLAPEKSAALQRDAMPGSGNAASLLAKGVLLGASWSWCC